MAVLAQIEPIFVEFHVLPLVLKDIDYFSQGNLSRKQMHTFLLSGKEVTLPRMSMGYVGDSIAKQGEKTRTPRASVMVEKSSACDCLNALPGSR